MPYIRYTWTDEVLPTSPTYTITDLGSGKTIELDQTPDIVGSEVTAARMNNIETGIDEDKLSSQNDAVTTGNIILVENTIHNQTIAGLTANRQNIFPVPSAIGKEITINTLDGDADYIMIPIGAATVTLNGGSAATADQHYNQFIANETTTWISTSLTNWSIKIDNLIPCVATFDRITSSGNTTHSANTHILADWNFLDNNIGNIGNLSTERATIKRVSKYIVTGAYRPAAAIADQKFAVIHLYKNGSPEYEIGARQAVSSGLFGFGMSSKSYESVVGDYYQYYFETEEANRGISIKTAFFEIKESR